MSLLQWLFRKKPEPEGLRDLLTEALERIRGLERAVKGVTEDYTDLREDIQRRFGRVWARLRTTKSDEAEEDAPPAPAPKPSLLELRQRFMSRRA